MSVIRDVSEKWGKVTLKEDCQSSENNLGKWDVRYH